MEPPASQTVAGGTLLVLEGRDALFVLDRISTNALIDLQPGRARATLFCDDRGRLLHRAIVGLDREGAIWILRHDAPGKELAEYIHRHASLEDLRIDDRGCNATIFQAPVSPRIDWPGGFGHVGAFCMCRMLHGEQVYALYGAPTRTDFLNKVAVFDSRVEASRIRAGLPRHGHEIHPDFNPFEVGLHHEVQLHKGCYPGRDALLRLTTHGSVGRRLALLEGDGDTPAAPAALLRRGEVVGQLTSCVRSGDGAWVGLGVLELGASEQPSGLQLAGGRRLRTAVPFPIEQPQDRF